MKRVDLRMPFTLGMVELTALKRCAVGWVRKAVGHFGGRQARELGEKFDSAAANRLSELFFVIGEEQKRAGGAELLSLKKHGCPRR